MAGEEVTGGEVRRGGPAQVRQRAGAVRALGVGSGRWIPCCNSRQ